LFEHFPVDNVFALHNAPELMAGVIATRPGAMTASIDLFDVTIRAQGCHGAFPHEGNDPIIIGMQMLTAWQTIISRNVNSQDKAVLSATSINAGDSWNVTPETAVIKGNVRALSPQVRALIKKRFYEVANHTAQAFGAEVDISYRDIAPSCVNDDQQTSFACDVAASIFGDDHVLRAMPTDMGSEDFAYLLQERPGCYLIIGGAPVPPGEDPLNGKSVEELGLEPLLFKNACMLHKPDYDFNDDIIPHGATLFSRLAEKYLSKV
jgi:hippurate hydrolase